MAVDTRNKRASILGIGLAAAIVFPNPDATVAQADRQQCARVYAGIDAGEGQVSPYKVLTSPEWFVVRAES